MDDEVRRLVEAAETCRYGTQRELAAALRMDPAKVSRLKVKAIRSGMITEKAWDLALAEAGREETEGAF